MAVKEKLRYYRLQQILQSTRNKFFNLLGTGGKMFNLLDNLYSFTSNEIIAEYGSRTVEPPKIEKYGLETP